MILYVGVFKLSTYSYLYPLKTPRNSDHPSGIQPSECSEYGLQMSFHSEGPQGSLEKHLIPGLGQDMYRLKLEHPLISDRKQSEISRSCQDSGANLRRFLLAKDGNLSRSQFGSVD